MSAIRWFEIPASDFDRAQSFYESVMNIKLHVQDMRETIDSIVGMFPHGEGIGGCLAYNPKDGYTPGDGGALVYLTVKGDLNAVLARVPDAGGEVLLPKQPLPPNAGGGYIGWVRDSEGNKVAFYSDE